MKISWSNLWILVAPLASAGACACSSDSGGGGDDGVTIVSTPLAGKINGQPWTFQSGQTDAFLSEGQDRYSGVFTSEPKAACPAFPNESHMYMYLAHQAGTYPLGLNNIATFTFAKAGGDFDNLGATKGRIVLDQVTDTTISGGAFVEFDANNSVNGRFEISICTE